MRISSLDCSISEALRMIALGELGVISSCRYSSSEDRPGAPGHVGVRSSPDRAYRSGSRLGRLVRPGERGQGGLILLAMKPCVWFSC